MELSILCGVKVYMFIFDINETRMMHYQSNINESMSILFKQSFNRVKNCNFTFFKDCFTNADYETIISKKDKDDDDESVIVRPNAEHLAKISSDIEKIMKG